MSDRSFDQQRALELPMPANIGRKAYERSCSRCRSSSCACSYGHATEGQRVVDPVRRPRHRRQGRHDPTPHRAPQPSLRAPRRAARALRRRARPVVLPALRRAASDAGEIVFFDRSWYNRAGVERVMGFATAEQVGRFFRQVVPFEEFLVNDGIHLVKIWLEVSQDEQLRRMDARRMDPLQAVEAQPDGRGRTSTSGTSTRRRWSRCSCSPTRSRLRGGSSTTTASGRAGINVLRHVLDQIPYAGQGRDGSAAAGPRDRQTSARDAPGPHVVLTGL